MGAETLRSGSILGNPTGSEAPAIDASFSAMFLASGSFANPTASVGLSPVNGSASTIMRSDAAPALNVTIAPTWTGLHNFSSGALIKGTTTNDNAAAGYVGEYIESQVATGTTQSLTSGTALNATQIVLTAGDWDVAGNVNFFGAGTTTVNLLSVSISDTSATQEFSPTSRLAQFIFTNQVLFAANSYLMNVGPCRFSLSGSATIYLVAKAVFATSTAQTSGCHLYARRRR